MANCLPLSRRIRIIDFLGVSAISIEGTSKIPNSAYLVIQYLLQRLVLLWLSRAERAFRGALD